MKCDELEEEYLWTNNVKTPSTIMVRAYNADDVDKAIAELKARIQLDDDEMAGFLDLEEECGGGDLRKYIAELKQKLEGAKNETNYWCNNLKVFAQKKDAEIAELKQKLSEKDAEIESLKASHYAEMVDAGMRERRLRRALYKACANWAKCEERINNRDAYDASEYLPSAEDKFRKKAERWSEIERKCRAKAEEYK